MNIFESFKSRKVEPDQEVTEARNDIRFPGAEAAISVYLEQYKGETSRAKILKKVFGEFLEQELKRTRVFKSEQSGVQFPYTSIKTGELARAVYEKILGGKLPPADSKLPAPRKQEFVFGTSILVEEGNQFTFMEVAMHECIKHLPSALRDLKDGKIPEEYEIFTLGMPTNTFGNIPPEAAEKICNNPSDELGRVYAEMVASEMRREAEPPKTVELFGMSLGASLAVRTGESLVEKRVATQNPKAAGLPYLQIRVEAPVALGTSKLKPLKISAGFLADAVLESRRRDVKKIEAGKPEFNEAVRSYLIRHGMKEKASAEEIKIKKKVMRSIIFALGRGLKPKPDTKVTEVYGLKDLTVATLGMVRGAALSKKQHAGKLGESLLERTNKNGRRFGADMIHLNPWFRENELRRMDELGRTMENLKSF